MMRFVWRAETMVFPAQCKVTDLVKLIHKQLTKGEITTYNFHNSCSFLPFKNWICKLLSVRNQHPASNTK